MNIITMQLKDLKPYKNNPRINDGAVEFVKRSIQEFGYLVPIVIDKNNEIVAGHTRYKALKKLKVKEVPCVVADDLTEDQIKAFRVADNSVSAVAEWDYNKLVLEMKDISLDLGQFGLDLGTISAHTGVITPVTEENEDEEDEGWYGDERERTYNAYNMDLVDYVDLTKDQWQMPIIHKTTFVPDDMIGFKYVKADNNENAEKCGIHCFIDDYQFERLWNRPNEYIELVRPYQCMLSPDFSLYTDMTMPTKIWNVYRSRLIGAYYQAQGVEIIPTVQWAQEDTFDFCFKGIEQGGTVAVSTIGVKEDPDALAIWNSGMQEMIKQCKPKCILVYGGKLDFDYGKIRVVYYENHQLEKWHKQEE